MFVLFWFVCSLILCAVYSELVQADAFLWISELSRSSWVLYAIQEFLRACFVPPVLFYLRSGTKDRGQRMFSVRFKFEFARAPSANFRVGVLNCNFRVVAAMPGRATAGARMIVWDITQERHVNNPPHSELDMPRPRIGDVWITQSRPTLPACRGHSASTRPPPGVEDWRPRGRIAKARCSGLRTMWSSRETL